MIARISVDTESKTGFMKLKSLKCLSEFKNVNQKYPLLRPFDGKCPDKCEPYAQSIQFPCINDRVIQFNLIIRRFRSSAKKKSQKINVLIISLSSKQMFFVSLCFIAIGEISTLIPKFDRLSERRRSN